MDSYNSGYYEHSYDNLVGDDGEYSLTPYYSCNDYPLLQESVPNTPSYEFKDYQNFPSEPPPFFTDYDPGPSYSAFAYSARSYCEPNYIEYEPAPYYHVQTRFVVSYSVAALDETDFEEYDPTPYGGGYNIVGTYGKPLPPSDQTCYPRSVPHPDSSSLSGVPLKPINDDSAPKPPVETKPTNVIDAVNDKPSDMDHGHQEEIVDKNGEEAGHGDQQGHHGKQVPYIPSGYGLEAMDLCEALFGYWPCLSRIKRTAQDCQEFGHHDHRGSYGNPWNGTADYLFGSLDPYSTGSRDDGGNFGNAVYGYEKHYQGKNQQVKYVNDPWLG